MSLGLDPVRTVRGVGVEQYRANLGEYLGAVAADAWANGPLSQMNRAVSVADEEVNARRNGERLLTAEEASEQGKELGLRFDAPIAQGAFNVLSDEKRRQAAAESVFKRARLENGYGTMSWLLGGGAEFLTMAADPVNIASAFVPVIGEARFAMLAARMGKPGAVVLRGAAEGAVGQALLEPLNVLDRRQLGDEYGMLDTLINLGFGGGLGVALHGAAYGAGAGFRFVRDRYEVRAPEAPAAAAPIVSPLREKIEAPTVEKSAEAPPVQKIAEKMEELHPATKETALRTAIAQLAQDKPVDIEPVLAADPNWSAIKAAIDAEHGEAVRLQAESVASQPLPTIAPPEGWQPSADELKLATRVSRGWLPEVELRRPQSLVDFVRRGGGLTQGTPEAAELVASDLGRQPGLLRKQGRQADHMAQAARDAGFRLGRETATGSGADVDAFVKALIEDASGRRKHFPDDAHTEAWRAQQDYFEQFRRDLETRGVNPKGMDPRQVAWMLAQDADTQRLMSLIARVDELGPESSLELAARLDDELALAMADIERQQLEPGAFDEGLAVDHREMPAATLEELERYHADVERLAGDGEAGQGPAGRRPAAGRADESGQAGPAGRGPADDPAEGAGLRRAPGEEGPAGAEPRTPSDLTDFAERQRSADLHADPAALAQRDERLAAEAREVKQLLDDDLRDYGHLLDEDDQLRLQEAARPFEEQAKGLDALAQCQIGGAA